MSPSLFKCFAILLSLFTLSTNAIPHSIRSVHHRSLAARVTVPEPATFPVPVLVRKRSLNKRCKPRSNSTSVAPISSAPVNVAPSPSLPQPSPPPQAAPSPSTHEAPAPSPSPQPPAAAPAPSVTHKPTPPSPSPQPQAAAPSPPPSPPSTSNSDEPSYLTGQQTGQGTFYATGLGACGITNNDNDHIAAVSHLLFDTFPGYNGVNPNDNPVCNRQVKATYQGKSVTVSITDRCTGCAITDLDFSPSAFDELADPSVGRISGMTWDWI